MPLIDLLRPDQRAALRRLRKRIANRENMRRYRRDPNHLPAVSRRGPAAGGRHLRPPDLARELPLHGVPQAAPLVAHACAQPRRGRPVRAARQRRGRCRARRPRGRGLQRSRPPARRPVRTRRPLPSLVAPKTQPPRQTTPTAGGRLSQPLLSCPRPRPRHRATRPHPSTTSNIPADPARVIPRARPRGDAHRACVGAPPATGPRCRGTGRAVTWPPFRQAIDEPGAG